MAVGRGDEASLECGANTHENKTDKTLKWQLAEAACCRSGFRMIIKWCAVLDIACSYVGKQNWCLFCPTRPGFAKRAEFPTRVTTGVPSKLWVWEEVCLCRGLESNTPSDSLRWIPRSDWWAVLCSPSPLLILKCSCTPCNVTAETQKTMSELIKESSEPEEVEAFWAKFWHQ